MPKKYIRKYKKEAPIFINPYFSDEEVDPESGTDLSNCSDNEDIDQEDDVDEENTVYYIIIFRIIDDDIQELDNLFMIKRELKTDITDVYLLKEPPFKNLEVKFIGKSFTESQRISEYKEPSMINIYNPFYYVNRYIPRSDRKTLSTIQSVINQMITKLEVEDRKERRKQEAAERQRKKQEEKEKRAKLRQQKLEEEKKKREERKEREKRDRLIMYACKLCVKSMIREVIEEANRGVRTITLLDGINTGVFKPGKDVLTIQYMNNIIKADLLENGKIRHAETGNIFNTPSNYSVQMKVYNNIFREI